MRQTRYSRNSVQPQFQQPEQVTTVRGVRQDKPLPPRARAASPQPGSVENVTRPRHMDTNTFRSQNPVKKHSTKRQKVKLSIWVDPPEKNELERLAESEGLSLSQTGRAIVVDGIRQRLRIEREVFAQPILEATIRNELRRSFSRIIVFQARIAMTLDVIKGLVKWLCRRFAGATKEQIDNVEARSRTDARVNFVKRTPQLERITEELEKTLMEGIS